MTKQIILTVEGLKAQEEELEYLKAVRRKEVAEKIKQALAFGDLSENSEYDEAKNEQAQLEIRILQIENTLKNAKVIDEEDVDTSVVSIGSTIRLFDREFNEEIRYTVVGSTEANLGKNKISDESPVGAALMGHAAGDVVSVLVPSGKQLEFEILEITK